MVVGDEPDEIDRPKVSGDDEPSRGQIAGIEPALKADLDDRIDGLDVANEVDRLG